MSSRKTNTRPANTRSAKVGSKGTQIGAFCDVEVLGHLERLSFPVTINAISSDGCSCEAPAEWTGDCDFLHLKIAGSIDINGRVLRRKGARAEIAFYGQLHPTVIDQLSRRAA